MTNIINGVLGKEKDKKKNKIKKRWKMYIIKKIDNYVCNL